MKAREFAELAGVTVRMLHHYDRIGLLRPRRSPAGYRIYREADLPRLEQIVALKFLGMPLKQIRGLLDRDGRDLPGALRSQRAALEEKRRMLDRRDPGHCRGRKLADSRASQIRNRGD